MQPITDSPRNSLNVVDDLFTTTVIINGSKYTYKEVPLKTLKEIKKKFFGNHYAFTDNTKFDAELGTPEWDACKQSWREFCEQVLELPGGWTVEIELENISPQKAVEVAARFFVFLQTPIRS